MLTPKEKTELTILHHTDHHTFEQDKRFNELLSKSYTRPARTLSKRPVKNTKLETANTWARINSKWGK